MRLTKQSNYAVRTLMYCAANQPNLSRVSEIARAYSISELFLFKLIRPLVESNILETTRGRNGGIRLARPASEISLTEAIKLTEDNFMLAECFDGGETLCPLVDHCEFNRALRAALDAFFATLGEYTIADLVANTTMIQDKLGIAEKALRKPGAESVPEAKRAGGE